MAAAVAVTVKLKDSAGKACLAEPISYDEDVPLTTELICTVPDSGNVQGTVRITPYFAFKAVIQLSDTPDEDDQVDPGEPTTAASSEFRISTVDGSFGCLIPPDPASMTPDESGTYHYTFNGTLRIEAKDYNAAELPLSFYDVTEETKAFIHVLKRYDKTVYDWIKLTVANGDDDPVTDATGQFITYRPVRTDRIGNNTFPIESDTSGNLQAIVSHVYDDEVSGTTTETTEYLELIGLPTDIPMTVVLDSDSQVVRTAWYVKLDSSTLSSSSAPWTDTVYRVEPTGANLSGKTILLDPGHAIAYFTDSTNDVRVQEWYIAKTIADRLQTLLKAQGADVLQTKTAGVFLVKRAVESDHDPYPVRANLSDLTVWRASASADYEGLEKLAEHLRIDGDAALLDKFWNDNLAKIKADPLNSLPDGASNDQWTGWDTGTSTFVYTYDLEGATVTATGKVSRNDAANTYALSIDTDMRKACCQACARDITKDWMPDEIGQFHTTTGSAVEKSTITNILKDAWTDDSKALDGRTIVEHIEDFLDDQENFTYNDCYGVSTCPTELQGSERFYDAIGTSDFHRRQWMGWSRWSRWNYLANDTDDRTLLNRLATDDTADSRNTDTPGSGRVQGLVISMHFNASARLNEVGGVFTNSETGAVVAATSQPKGMSLLVATEYNADGTRGYTWTADFKEHVMLARRFAKYVIPTSDHGFDSQLDDYATFGLGVVDPGDDVYQLNAMSDPVRYRAYLRGYAYFELDYQNYIVDVGGTYSSLWSETLYDEDYLHTIAEHMYSAILEHFSEHAQDMEDWTLPDDRL